MKKVILITLGASLLLTNDVYSLAIPSSLESNVFNKEFIFRRGAFTQTSFDERRPFNQTIFRPKSLNLQPFILSDVSWADEKDLRLKKLNRKRDTMREYLYPKYIRTLGAEEYYADATVLYPEALRKLRMLEQEIRLLEEGKLDTLAKSFQMEPYPKDILYKEDDFAKHRKTSEHGFVEIDLDKKEYLDLDDVLGNEPVEPKVTLENRHKGIFSKIKRVFKGSAKHFDASNVGENA
jgi:hypothetical protein